MKIIRQSQTQEFKNSDYCKVFEYPMGDQDINGAVSMITGRYPGTGRVVNKECKELAFVIKGSGRVVIEEEEIGLHEGDLVLIDAGERFYWDGDMTVFVTCTPAWYNDQHLEVA